MHRRLYRYFSYSLWLTLFLLSGCEQSPKEEFRREATRLVKPLNQQWQFVKADPKNAHSLPADRWKKVSLPHTWNAKDGQDGGDDYYRGTGIYKRTFTLDESLANKNIYIHFDGATTTAEVYINGQRAGVHKGNYAAFRYDITDHVHFDKENLLVVTVNNEVDDNVAPLSADFTFFGGLYRRARLIVTDKTHIDTLNYASNGVFWSQDNITREHAQLSIRSTLVNEADVESALTVTAKLLDAKGRLVAATSKEVTLAAGESHPFSAQLSLDKPHLWHGRPDPYLYSAELSLSKNGKTVDQVSHPLGLRYFQVDKDKGFILNGEPYPLYGVNRMADFPNKGTAINQEDHERDLQLILELGATAVRLGHQQRDEYVYRRADETGLVIWAEVPLINRINTNEEFSDNVKQQALELIRQNYNHSAIMFWGLFNEITLKPGPDPRALVQEINQLVKREDPTRLTTAAVAASGDGALQDPLATTTDITSFNRYYGWYYGDFKDITKFMDQAREEYPERRVALSEFGAGASDKLHSDKPVMQDHSEEYQAIFHEKYWEDLNKRPYVWGKFLWVLADFAVDNRDEGDTSGRNDKGLVTFDRKIKKDAFFWYKANWSDEPLVHITGRRFTERTTPTVNIKVYSNQDTLELVVNGRSLGSQNLDGERKLIWRDVPLKMGENRIQAITANGKLKDNVTLTRINSNSTEVSSALLGVDSKHGRIFNLPYGTTFPQLAEILTFPEGSRIELVKGDANKALPPGAVLRVIAQDTITTQDYTLVQAPVSVAKTTSASAEIASPLSIGPIDIPAMSAAHANDGIVVKDAQGLDETNIWNAMGDGPHWWKVDLGSEYYVHSLEVVWPQHMELITPGPISYSVEVARHFEQTFDNFSENYREAVDRSDNAISGTTVDPVGTEARFVRIRLYETKTFVDAPVVGKYPIYGAEEISVIGGLLKSNSLDVDYKTRTITSNGQRTVAELALVLNPVSGGSLLFTDAQGATLNPSATIKRGVQVIASNSDGKLKEGYTVK